MPNSIRPGDVLADRYRLVDLLNESGGGRFWRAHDKVLERHVALHVIPADDERAAGLLEAARQSATVHDRRVLRVLDADQTDEVCYVVNEWGAGASLDIMVATDGPFESPSRGLARLRGRRVPGRRTRRGRGPRPAGPRERPDRRERLGAVDRLLRRRRPARSPGRPDRHRRGRPGEPALLRADREVARDLELHRAVGPPGARPGAAPAAGPCRRAAPAGLPVRSGDQPVRRQRRHARPQRARPLHRPGHQRRPRGVRG